MKFLTYQWICLAAILMIIGQCVEALSASTVAAGITSFMDQTAFVLCSVACLRISSLSSLSELRLKNEQLVVCFGLLYGSIFEYILRETTLVTSTVFMSVFIGYLFIEMLRQKEMLTFLFLHVVGILIIPDTWLKYTLLGPDLMVLLFLTGSHQAGLIGYFIVLGILSRLSTVTFVGAGLGGLCLYIWYQTRYFMLPATTLRSLVSDEHA